VEEGLAGFSKECIFLDGDGDGDGDDGVDWLVGWMLAMICIVGDFMVGRFE
jgi:hypothetical protein